MIYIGLNNVYIICILIYWYLFKIVVFVQLYPCVYLIENETKDNNNNLHYIRVDMSELRLWYCWTNLGCKEYGIRQFVQVFIKKMGK